MRRASSRVSRLAAVRRPASLSKYTLASAWPLLSLTMKQEAFASSMSHGGGKRWRASQIEPLMIMGQGGVKHSDIPARCPRLSSIRFTLPKGAQNTILARTTLKGAFDEEACSAFPGR